MPAETLLDFCKGLGLDAATIKSGETPERVALDVSVPAGKFQDYSSKVRGLVSTFGSSLECTVGLESTQPLLTIDQDLSAQDVDAALAQIEALPANMPLQVQIKVDKGHFIEALGLDPTTYHGLYYFFLENLLKLLQSPLPSLERTLFPDAQRSTVVIVSDTSAVCQGDLFVVYGYQSKTPLIEVLPSVSEQRREEVKSFQSLAPDGLNWIGFRLQNLTPLHLVCDCGESNANLSSILANRLLQLAIVYTANRATLDGSKLVALYASSDQSASIVPSKTDGATGLRGDVGQLLSWLQDPGKTEKLTILQNTIAREITGDVPADNFEVFVEKLPHILAEARWNYRVYVDGKINKHFDKVQAVNAQIAAASKGISQTLDTMTKGFVDTLLASVGVVILTLLASLAENKTQGIIFRAGMWIYAAYILVFQVFYRMGSLYYSHILALREYEEQLRPFKDALEDTKIQPLTLSLEARKHHFRRMYWVTIGLYALIIVLIVLAGAFVPSVIVQLGGDNATPSSSATAVGNTATPTPSPAPTHTPTALSTEVAPAATATP